jgi:hypothetical protein
MVRRKPVGATSVSCSAAGWATVVRLGLAPAGHRADTVDDRLVLAVEPPAERLDRH